MKYLDKSFSVTAGGNRKYRNEYDRIFGPKCIKCKQKYEKMKTGNYRCKCGIIEPENV